MASVLPFRPWNSPAPRVFRSRAARGQSTSPARGLSCTSAPPQRIFPKPVARSRKPGRPCSQNRTPRFAPRPFSMSKRKNPFSRPARAGRLKSRATLSKSPVPRVWLPSRRCQSFRPRKPLSVSHAPGLNPPELFSDPAAHMWFPTRDPPLRFGANPVGLALTLRRFPLAWPAVLPALLRTCGWSGANALLSFSPSGLASAGSAKKPFSSSHPSRSFQPGLRRNREAEPQGMTPTARLFPPFEGRWPA
jgi:hypothetical protein